MSAINSNSDDRDLEAIRRAQRAHEPSMEEILASIRNIIADEREPPRERRAQTGAARAAPAPGRKSSTPRTPPRRTASASEPAQPARTRTRRKSFGAGRKPADSEPAADCGPAR